MMIQRNLSIFATQLAGASRRVMPRMRDREVPYGVKGGELHGR
jgi:hypothetical protein